MNKIQIEGACGSIDWIVEKMLKEDLNNPWVMQFLILELHRVQEAIRTGKHPMLVPYERLSF